MIKPQLNFRIIVEAPVAGVVHAMQRGKSDVVAPIRSTKQALTFEFPLTLADIDAEPPRLTGEFAQGPAKQRFVYINTGAAAGQAHTPWRRRAKVPLYTLDKAVLERALKDNKIIETRIHGVAKDGGPACATVPLLQDWCVDKA